MNIRKLIIPFAAVLTLGTSGLALAEEPAVSGKVDLGARLVEERNNSAKYLEYRDYDDGLFGAFLLNFNRKGYYLELSGRNVGISDEHVGLDDQSYKLKGGKYDSFKYFLKYDEIIHNFSFNNKSPFTSGIGTRDLTFSGAGPASTNTSTWTTFDQSIKRTTFGGGFETWLGTPFYLSVKGYRQHTDGTLPYSAPSAGATFTGSLSRSAGVIDLPKPIDYRSDTLLLEAGYRTKPLIVSLTGTINQFENDAPYLIWRDPNGTAAYYNTNSLAPESQLIKGAASVTVRLPLDSALALRGSHSIITNAVDLSPYNARAGVNDFNGEITYSTASVAYTISPVKPLDVKAYYNYLKKDNDSYTFSDYMLNHASSTATSSPTEVYFYKKHNAGLDVGYRLPLDNKIDTGYEYLRVRRNGEIRKDAVSSTDNRLYVQLKNSTLEDAVFKLRYEYLNRDAKNSVSYTTPNAGFYDAADLKRHTVKAGVELEPLEHLDVGLEYAFKDSDYYASTFGIQEEYRHEVLLDAAYEFPNIAKLSGYFDYERIKVDANHNKTTSPAYTWTEAYEDNNFGFGFAAEVPIIKNRLKLVAGFDYADADIMRDLTANTTTPFSAATTEGVLRIDNYGDYTKKSVGAKAIYSFSKNLDLTTGYAYDRYKYTDISFEGYTYFLNSGTNDAYLIGAYTDQSYEAHVGYLMASYRF